MNLVEQTLRQLRPDDGDWYAWAKVDDAGNQIPNDQRMCWEHAISIKEGVTKPTKEEFDSKFIEVEAEWHRMILEHRLKKAYQIESDPLFFKWQAGECSKQEWLDARAKVKSFTETEYSKDQELI
jgi:hypothetical protein